MNIYPAPNNVFCFSYVDFTNFDATLASPYGLLGGLGYAAPGADIFHHFHYQPLIIATLTWNKTSAEIFTSSARTYQPVLAV